MLVLKFQFLAVLGSKKKKKKKKVLFLDTMPEKHMVSLAELLHTWQNKSQQQETKIFPATFSYAQT